MPNRITSINQAANILLNGGVGVIPTDTVYGLVARAADKSAVSRLYHIKSRDSKPGTLIAANIGQLVDLGIPAGRLKIAERYWPGPVSVIIDLDDNLDYLHQNISSLAIRVVADEKTRKLLELTGPLITSSANKPAEPVANNTDEAIIYFEDSADFYLDGGDMSNRKSSTIIRVFGEEVEIIREGAGF